MLKVAVASALYFLVHSAFANDWTKTFAAELFGQRHAGALYRPFYLTQGLVLLALLAVYVRRQPDRDLCTGPKGRGGGFCGPRRPRGCSSSRGRHCALGSPT